MSDEQSTSHLPPNLDVDKQTEIPAKPKRGWSQTWESIVRMGMGEIALRVGTALASISLILLVVWVMGNFYLKGNVTTYQEAAAAPIPTSTATVDPVQLVSLSVPVADIGITRLAQLHTILPTRPRFDVIEYTVVKGDTLTGIAEKYNLKPATLLFGNYETLSDNPEILSIGMKLNILPVNGTYYKWHDGDNLVKVAAFFKVKPEEIINWPGNHLDSNTVGDYMAPNIQAGSWLVVPNGQRDFVSFTMPMIPRTNPATAHIAGAGACPAQIVGPTGTGTFVWPTTEKWLSGYDYTPAINHFGIDIAGQMGNSIFAADSGVVVYAGWNDFGYGNLIVIDHGSGWQTRYAHLSVLNVGCGSWVSKGQTIGYMGSTGRSTGAHLHFELFNEKLGRVNPWDYLKK